MSDNRNLSYLLYVSGVNIVMTSHVKNFVAVNTAATSGLNQHQITPKPPQLYHKHLKRVMDVFLVILAAPFALPLIALFALLALRDGASPFFYQRRIGKNGEIFDMIKIRTMVPDAPKRLKAYLDSNPDARAEWDTTQKLKNDPRITPVGRFLRKSSLDELPQLWNVLRGDMSIVGPRPMMEDQKALYPGLTYYALRPGITGPWQVSDRNATTFSARARFDTDYYNTLSLKTDLSILARTIGVVLRCTGY